MSCLCAWACDLAYHAPTPAVCPAALETVSKCVCALGFVFSIGELRRRQPAPGPSALEREPALHHRLPVGVLRRPGGPAVAQLLGERGAPWCSATCPPQSPLCCYATRGISRRNTKLSAPFCPCILRSCYNSCPSLHKRLQGLRIKSWESRCWASLFLLLALLSLFSITGS